MRIRRKVSIISPSSISDSRGTLQMSDSTLRDEAREAIQNGAESYEKSFAVFEEHAPVLLAAIVDSSDDAIVSKTLDGVITSWNGGAERMFGWPAQMAIGKHITLIVPEDRRAEEDDVLARLRRGSASIISRQCGWQQMGA